METWGLNQVASAQVENGMDCTSEEGGGRVGGATGEEGGERGRGAVVRAASASAELASVVSVWGKGLAEDAWEEAWEEA